jgi:hypothetical protein
MLFRHMLFLSAILLLFLSAFPALAQSTPSAGHKLSLNASLVLTPEFCATVSKQGSEKFQIGKASCKVLAPTLQNAFSSIRQVDDGSKTGDAQVVLEPRFANTSTTHKNFAFSSRELVVGVEWTVRDPSGKIIWLGTVQGTAKRHVGNAFTYAHNAKKILELSAQNMADESAATMSSATELLKFSAAPVK